MPNKFYYIKLDLILNCLILLLLKLYSLLRFHFIVLRIFLTNIFFHFIFSVKTVLTFNPSFHPEPIMTTLNFSKNCILLNAISFSKNIFTICFFFFFLLIDIKNCCHLFFAKKKGFFKKTFDYTISSEKKPFEFVRIFLVFITLRFFNFTIFFHFHIFTQDLIQLFTFKKIIPFKKNYIHKEIM